MYSYVIGRVRTLEAFSDLICVDEYMQYMCSFRVDKYMQYMCSICVDEYMQYMYSICVDEYM